MKIKSSVLSWNDYFMSIALLSAKRSKDPRTQVGACIVDEYQHIIGVGYNGMPNGNDKGFSWERDGDWLHTKYPYVVHAELNAILNSTKSLRGSSIYVSLFPCQECAKAIVQAGIKKVYYLSDKHKDTEGNKASKHIFDMSNITTQQIILKKSILLEEPIS